MEEGVLSKRGKTLKEIWEERKWLRYLAEPAVAVALSFYLLKIISLIMVGHLGKLALSSAAIAFSLAGITGFIFLLGMASALETISGQAYGAQQYEKLGTQTYTAILSLLIVCVPISVLWVYVEDLLMYVGQDPQISSEAGIFSVWLIPALFGFAILQPLIRYYQMQSLTLPILISSCITLSFHIPLCWALVFKSGLKSIGGAVAMDISMWLNVAMLGLYMKCSPRCRKTRAPFSMKIFKGMREFFRFAIPSALMICLEWWSFELLVLLSGLLPNPQLEISVLSVCLNIVVTHYAILFGFAAEESTRVSEELGAGWPEGARGYVMALMLLAAVNAYLVSFIILFSRNVFGYIFSNEKEVVDYVANIAPLFCLSITIYSFQGVFSGTARGYGWQHLTGYIHLVVFYLLGVPIAAALAFWFDFRGTGLWIGILCGVMLQSFTHSIIMDCTNEEKQAAKARERLFEEESLSDNSISLPVDIPLGGNDALKQYAMGMTTAPAPSPRVVSHQSKRRIDMSSVSDLGGGVHLTFPSSTCACSEFAPHAAEAGKLLWSEDYSKFKQLELESVGKLGVQHAFQSMQALMFMNNKVPELKKEVASHKSELAKLRDHLRMLKGEKANSDRLMKELQTTHARDTKELQSLRSEVERLKAEMIEQWQAGQTYLWDVQKILADRAGLQAMLDVDEGSLNGITFTFGDLDMEAIGTKEQRPVDHEAGDV